MKKTRRETADRWLTGIVEVQLPADARLRTSRRRAEPRRRCWIKSTAAGRRGDGPPASRQAELAASRAALRVEDDGGFQKAEASANLKLSRKEFAAAFGRVRHEGEKPRH